MNKVDPTFVVARFGDADRAAAPSGAPHIANAAATTASAWWAQGFAQEEDMALRKIVADYEKASGNTIELSIVPFAPLRQKIISAMTSGAVPDVIDANPLEVVPRGGLERTGSSMSAMSSRRRRRTTCPTPCSPPAATTMSKSSAAITACRTRRRCGRSIYWRDLVEKAGYKESDIPNTWDAFIDFFKPVQQKLRDQGMRHVYATGFVLSTVGYDVATTFDQFLIAYGGIGLVTPDGQLHADDPQVREAALKALTYLGDIYKGGYVPPGTLELERRRRQQRLPLKARASWISTAPCRPKSR